MSKQQAAAVDPTKSAVFTKLVDDCIEARKRFERSEVDYLDFLADAEVHRRESWSPAYGSFDDFIEHCVGKPDPARYRNFTTAVAKLGMEKLREIGLDACVQLLKVEPTKARSLERAYRAWSDEHGGVHPSGRFANQIRQQVAPVEVIPMPVRRQEEIQKLRLENAELRRECERLRKENETLKAAAGGARKPASKSA